MRGQQSRSFEESPQYNPCDIPTSDTSPRVATSETVVHLRIVEHFMLNDLDMHC